MLSRFKLDRYLVTLVVIGSVIVAVAGCGTVQVMRVPSLDDSDLPPETLAAVSGGERAMTPTVQVGGISSEIRTIASIEVSASGIIYGDFPGFHSMDWSPDGGALAYTKDNKIWVRELAQDASREIRSIPNAQLNGVYYSPDGTHLAVTGMRASLALAADSNMVWTMKTTGEGLQDAAISLEMPTLAKFGKHWLSDARFSFSIWAGNGIQWLYSVNTEGNQIEKLIEDPLVVSGRRVVGGEYYFSQDLMRLAIQSPFRNQKAVMPLDAPGDAKWQVPESSELLQYFQAWMPDNDHFLFMQWQAGNPIVGGSISGLDLWRGSSSTGKVEQLLEDVVAANPSPDGTQIAFLRQLAEEWGSARATGLNPNQFAGVTALKFGIYDRMTGTAELIAPAGYEREDTADDPLRYWQIAKPVWSPDGQFVDFWGGDSNLWIASRDGQVLSKVTDGLEVVQTLCSPTSTHLALRTRDRAWIIQTPNP